MNIASDSTVQATEVSNKSLNRFIIISLLFHISFLLILDLRPFQRFAQEIDTKENETIIVEFAPTSTKDLNQQIVETDLINKTKEAKDNAFLSSANQSVEKQTKAKIVAAHKSGRVGGIAGQQAPIKEESKPLSLGSLGLNVNFKPTGHMNPGEQAQNNDYLKEVKEGSQTLLNTKEFAFFGFYQRVRKQLEQFWEPGLKEHITQMLDRGRTIASDKEHATKLLVVMNSNGSITKVLVENTSGLLDLDQAAIDAFNRAGPFPNPPKEMVETDGTVKVEWEFVLRT